MSGDGVLKIICNMEKEIQIQIRLSQEYYRIAERFYTRVYNIQIVKSNKMPSQTLKIFLFLIILTLFESIASVPEKPILLYQKREGICSTFPKSCPKSKQLNGICCRVRGVPRYYKNFCLACQDGCDTFVYRSQRDGEICRQEDL